MGHQGAQQKLAVDPVRLRPPRPLPHRNARRIEHKVRDPGRFQQPMQPKAVIAGFIAAHHTRHRSELLRHPGADPFDQRQQFSVIAPVEPTFAPDPGSAASPATSSDSVRSQQKLCQGPAVGLPIVDACI
jgi:hypothetical protein